jgi:hypothetical protein
MCGRFTNRLRRASYWSLYSLPPGIRRNLGPGFDPSSWLASSIANIK